MTDSNVSFVGSIPEFYDRHLGPVLFRPYGEDLVGRLVLSEGCRVLELAGGTGIVTHLLLERLPRTGRLTATDLNEPMLAHAKKRVPADERLTWRQADATELPFPTASFDLVVCQFGVMFFPDKPAAVREARRVLRSGGLFAFNVWDALARNPFGQTAHQTIARFFPVDPPTFYQVPFGFSDPEAIRDLLSGNGFTTIDVAHVALEVEAVSARHLAVGLVEGNPISVAIRERGGVEPEVVIDAVADALAPGAMDSPLKVRMRALAVTARAA